MEKPITVKSLRGEEGPEAEDRLYQLLLFLLQVATEEEANDTLQKGSQDRDTPAA